MEESDEITIAFESNGQAELGGTEPAEPEPRENSTETASSTKKRSKVYEHFDELKDEFQCKYCKGKYRKEKSGGTGNILKHLRFRHPAVQVETKSKQLLRTQTIEKSFKKAEEVYSARKLERMVLDHIILSNQPFSLIEEETFAKLLLYGRVAPPEIPTARTIRDQVLKLYDIERNKLVEKMKNVKSKVSLIVDGWRSRNLHSFEGIIATWITKDWEYEYVVLDFDVVSGSHSGAALAESLHSVLVRFGIDSNLLAITTDNAGNMVTMCQELSQILNLKGVPFDADEFHIRCMAHIINLSCQSSLKVLKNISPSAAAAVDITVGEEEDTDVTSPSSNLSLYSRIKETFKILRKSDPLRDSLRNFCDLFELEYLQPMVDMPVRWNSTFKMLQRALKLRKPLDAVMRNSEKLCGMALSESEWGLLEEMTEFLQPFSDMTDKISVQHLPTLSLTALIFHDLLNHVKAYDESSHSNDSIKEAALNAKKKLLEYYPKSDALVCVIGLVLDPRCKLHWYSTVGFSIRTLKKAVTDHWERFYKPKDNDATLNQDADEGDLFDIQMKKAKFDKKDELQKYLAELPIRSSTLPNGAFGWWQANESVYPNLARMARDFLAASGTGVPIEATFSMGTDVVTNKRHNLSKETIRALMCLKSWLKFQSREDFRTAMATEIVKKMRGGDDEYPELF